MQTAQPTLQVTDLSSLKGRIRGFSGILDRTTYVFFVRPIQSEDL
jgi:hypothetical protein